MIGAQTGAQIHAGNGARISPAVPVDLDAIRDVYVPSTDAQWTALGEAAPSSIWLCSEASGNLIDANGNLDLVATSSPSYEQATDDWSRPGVGFADGTVQRFVVGSGVGPPPTEPTFWLYYITLRTEPTLARIVGGAARCSSSTDNARVGFSPSAGVNRLSLNCDGVSAAGTADHGVGAHVIGFLYNPDGAVVAAYSELEMLTGTFSADIVDGDKGVGSNASPDMVCHAAWMWRGASARLSHAQVKARLQKLRWAIPWST